MSVSMLIALIACVFMFVSVILYPIRRRFLLRRLGPCEYPFRGKFRFQFIGVLLAAPLLVVSASLRGLGFPVLLMVSAVAVLLFILAYRDLLHVGLGGLYEHGIVWNGQSLMYAKIVKISRPDPYTIVLSSDRPRARLVVAGSADFIGSVHTQIEKNASPLQ